MKEQKIKAALCAAMTIGREQIPHGSVTAYIPEPAKAHRDAQDICVTLPDGSVRREGDTSIPFTIIQSVSKVISLCKVLEVRGGGEGLQPGGHGAVRQGLQLDRGDRFAYVS